jgi:hypothetical protein
LETSAHSTVDHIGTQSYGNLMGKLLLVQHC